MLALDPRWKPQDGYTLIEMIIVGALVIVGSIIAIPVTIQMVSNAKGDSAQVMLATFLETARNRAVAERRNVELTFLSDTTMQLERIEVPDGTRTIIGSLQLEGDSEFLRGDAGLPDTPALFGGTETVNYSTGAPPAMFTSDGSLIDSAGDVVNVTIYIARPDRPETQRAITISGVTGLVRSYKWRGAEWLQ